MVDDRLMHGKHWLEPCMPSAGKEPAAMLIGAEQMIKEASRLSALADRHTLAKISALLRVTNSYYTNLIEGQRNEPVEIAQGLKQHEPNELRTLALTHLYVQSDLEQKISSMTRVPLQHWGKLFCADFLSDLHRRLFYGLVDDLTLRDGFVMIPGELRSVQGREVIVGTHHAPAADSVQAMLSRLEQAYSPFPDTVRRIIAVMACHHRLAFIHPFPDGNGRVVRLATHLQLHSLNLAAPLWSLSRGLARRQQDYYRLLSAADEPRRGDLDSRGQLSYSALCEFIEFMIEVSLDQMRYIATALDIRHLTEAIRRAIAYAPLLRQSKIKQECAEALQVLFTQGAMERSVFKRFTGLGDRTATEQLSKLVEAGVVEAPTPKSRTIQAGLPLWYASELFPDLHRSFA